MISSEASMVTTSFFPPDPFHMQQTFQPVHSGHFTMAYSQPTVAVPMQQTQQPHYSQYENVLYHAPNCVPVAAHDGRYPTTPSTNALDSCQQISHVLQCYQQGGEDSEFVRKAIESLVKKLKDKRIELDALITAITSAGKQQTPCVTIQRSLDGRLQVAGRKGVPHVVYARIWRWPNVNKNELVKLPICSIHADHPDFICINPYHYERVVSNGISPLDMKSLRLEPPDLPANEYDIVCTSSESNSFEWQQTIPQPDYSSHYGSSRIQRQVDLNSVQIPMNSAMPEYWCSIRYYELDSQVGETFKVPRGMDDITIDGGLDPQGTRNRRFCLGALSNVHRSEASEKCRMHIGGGVCLRFDPNGNVRITFQSQKPVFVKSGFLDYLSGQPYGAKVYRFTANTAEITVFDLRWAYYEMQCRTRSAAQAYRAQAAAVAGHAAPGSQGWNLSDIVADSGVDGMRSSFCTLSMSFVKGWGHGYPRTSIKETPCWIEVQLDRPLQLLDHLLKTAGPL